MSIKNWILLLFVYILYLCLGGVIFQALECPNFLENKNANLQRQAALFDAINTLKEKLEEEQVEELDQIIHLAPLGTNGSVWNEDCDKWDFYNSLFFSFTAVTTIGYGHQAPETNYGRLVCIFYSLIGIPLNAILIGALGSLFSNKISQMKKKAVLAGENGLDGIGKVGRIVLEGIVWFLIFTSLFVFLPAALFSYGGLEDESWEYIDSVYYTFITLLTIGFGDLVAGRNENKGETSPVVQMLYQILIIIWIIFGLGYIFGVVNLLTEALESSSKPMKRAFQGLKNQIYVNDYWRKIMNEIISMKQGEGGEWSEGELMDGAGGGSEPCLGKVELTVEDSTGKKRSVSTGDLDDGLESINAENLYAQLGGRGEDKRQSLPSLDQEQYMASIQELNEDTITSLQQFLTTANVSGMGENMRSWLENNVPGGVSLPPTRPVSRQSSHLQYNSTVIPRTREDRLSRRKSLQHDRLGRKGSNISRVSTNSHRSTVSTGPVGSLLEHTTLGEFLAAVESVKAKSEAELMVSLEVEKNSTQRKNSVFRKLSFMSNRGVNKDPPPQGPLTLSQVTSLLSVQNRGESDAGSNNSQKPLILMPSSSLHRDMHKDTVSVPIMLSENIETSVQSPSKDQGSTSLSVQSISTSPPDTPTHM